MVRLEVEVAQLKKREALTKKKATEEFKSSYDFHEAVVIQASTYFGWGFNFCKRQLAYHHPNPGIDLNNMDMDRDLLEREEAKVDEENKGEDGEVEKEQEKGEDKGDTSPLSL